MAPLSQPSKPFNTHALWSASRKPFRLLVSVFGLIWLMNSGFQFFAWLAQPGGRGSTNLIKAFTEPAGGAPSWLKPYILAVAQGVERIGPHTIAIAMILIAALIGFALLFRVAVAAAAWLGIVYCFFCWTTLNALGYPYAGGQTDPGVFVPYMISFVFILSVRPVITETQPGVARFPNRFWTVGRILFGFLWAFDATLKWQPGFLFHFLSQLTSVVPGQPSWIAAYLGLVIDIVRAVGPLVVAVMTALMETSISLSLLTGRALQLFVPLGLLWSLAVWSTAETFGGPYTSAGTGVRGNVIGNVLIYAIIFILLWTSLGIRIPRRSRRQDVAAV